VPYLTKITALFVLQFPKIYLFLTSVPIDTSSQGLHRARNTGLLQLQRPFELIPNFAQDAWVHCRETFGEGNVLIVSNSAGTMMDPGDLQVCSCSSCMLPSSRPTVPILAV
jgi:hypothetical protein